MKIDLNCDMGESYGVYKIGMDNEIFPLISSANIACGFHAGDPSTILQTIRLAIIHDVAIGAHPSLPDRVGFGRREMKIRAEELYADLVYQIGAVKAMAESEGTALHHVKAHGALYNMAVVDQEIAEAIVEVVATIDPKLILYTLPHGALLAAAQKRGLQVAREFFIDRNYTDSGRLVARSHPDALLKDATVAAKRVLRMLKTGKIESLDGTSIEIEAETLCIHGDEASALLFAQEIVRSLHQEGIQVSAIGYK